MSFPSNATASLNPPAIPQLLHIVQPPWHDPHRREDFGPDLDEERSGRASPEDFEPLHEAAPALYDTRVGGRTVSDWLRGFGQSAWQPPAAGEAAPETLRSEVINALGGRRSELGAEASRQFSRLGRHLHQLKRIRDHFAEEHPDRRDEVHAAARELMARAVERMSHGRGEGDAAATLMLRMEPRAEAAQAVAVRAPQGGVEQQIHRIRAFWISQVFTSEESLYYLMTGTMIFKSIQDMEEKCPGGNYLRRYDPRVDKIMQTDEFVYPDGGVTRVFLTLAEGLVEVAFRGPTWIYKQWDTPQTLAAGQQPTPDPRRHVNPHWSDDPEVIEARARYARMARGERR
ncbi:hypothetical protein GT347_13825 [Xylophilus rhododendri]|uniref:Uncharacterized protein n=1 Tax=Xylophilus rhododendri TaxID=2697032 RepID=A0A857J7E1_9BURK|nr:hypothetical protein [Xylophilus rhododendri]QHI98971.1 hypothetical protein GT347_13825 [Xylophilus rhododendri]